MNRAAVDPVTVVLPQLVSLAFPVAAVAGRLPDGSQMVDTQPKPSQYPAVGTMLGCRM